MTGPRRPAAPREGTLKISPDTSAQIKVCRVLCIFFMMYVHVWPGFDTVEARMGQPLAFLNELLVDLLGRASVPALTLISGFLMVVSLEHKGAVAVNKGRLPKILVPMITWNLVAIALAWLIFRLGHPLALYEQLRSMDAVSIVAFKVLALNNDGATVALNFLRDLLVCGLLIVPMVWAVKRLGLWAVGAVGVASVVVGFEPLIYRANIPVFFMLGIHFALKRGHLRPTRAAAVLTAALLVAVVVFDVVVGLDVSAEGYLPATYEIVRRLVVSAAFLMASHWLAQTAARSFFYRCERSIFLVFLSHSALFLLSWGVWKQVMGPELDAAYLVFFLASPVVCLAVITLIPQAVWDRLPGWFQVLIRGDVMRRAQPALRAEAAVAARPKVDA